MPEADMRAYCATELLKALINAGKGGEITKEDLQPTNAGHYYYQYKALRHSEYTMYSEQHPNTKIYELITTEEQRLGRAAVKMADGLLWALENIGRPKKKKKE
jgi:hypothetical protein